MRLVITLLLFFSIEYVWVKPIENDKDALTYLTQLGYNKNPCKSLSKLSCSVSSASIIRQYQKAFGLKETGKFDEATKELLNKPRCGNSDLQKSSPSSMLASIQAKWSKNHLKWTIRNVSSRISAKQTEQIIDEAFMAWTKYIPLNLEKVCEDCKADIVFDFSHGDHHDGFPFEGPGYTLAHAFFPEDGRIHFDASEQWTEKFDGNDYNLYLVAVHEIGHALGLPHDTHNENSIMYPTYHFMDKHRVLSDTDQRAIVDVYGSRNDGKTFYPYNNAIIVLRNKATSKILDSNWDGHVYSLDLNNGDHQKWMLIQQDDGTYILKNIATSRVLDSNGNEVYTLGANGGNYQKWRFHRQHDGSYVLENLATARVLNSDSKAAAGQLHSSGDDSQKWFFAATGINPYNNMIAVLMNKLTNKILDSNWDGHVYTLDLNNGDHQKWMVGQQDDGTYILKNIATSRVLDSNGKDIYTLGANGGNYQKWRFHRQHDNSHILENLATSRVLNSDSKAAAGQLHSNGDDSQKWFFAETGINPRNNMIAVLTNKLTKKILDSNWNGHVYTLDLNNGDHQKWMLVQQDDGTYILKNIATSRVLDFDGNVIYTLGANGGNYQKWRFHRQHDNSYVLENLATSRVLNSDSKGVAGQPHSNGNDSQKWFFTAR